MRILCDVCSGELVVDAGGKTATCQSCGMPHTIERVREKLTGGEVKKVPAQQELEMPRTVETVNKMAAEEEQVYDAVFEVVEEDVADAAFEVVAECDSADVYKQALSPEELATREGRVGAYYAADQRTWAQVHADVASYVKSDIFAAYTVEENVSADSVGADNKCMKLDFLFKKGGRAVLAVAILKSPRRKHGAVTGVIDACKANGIRYVDFFVGMPNTKYYVMRKLIEALGI